jgi:hypothetical protein
LEFSGSIPLAKIVFQRVRRNEVRQVVVFEWLCVAAENGSIEWNFIWRCGGLKRVIIQQLVTERLDRSTAAIASG